MTTPDPQAFEPHGDTVKVLRRGAGLTLQALADRAGVKRETVRRIEEGLNKRRAPSIGTVGRIARALDATYRELEIDRRVTVEVLCRRVIVMPAPDEIVVEVAA